MDVLRLPAMTRIAIVVLFVLLSAKLLAASPLTVDQSYAPLPSTVDAGVSSGAQEAETFTVAISGLLSQVDVFVSRVPYNLTGDLIVQLLPTVDGVPVTDNSLALATAVIHAADIPTSPIGQPAPAAAFFSASGFAVPVEAGEVLAIMLSTADQFGYSWSGGSASYLAGGLFQRGLPFDSAWTVRDEWDLAFREYVDTSVQPVPEPPSAHLLAFELALLMIVLVRKRLLSARVKVAREQTNVMTPRD